MIVKSHHQVKNTALLFFFKPKRSGKNSFFGINRKERKNLPLVTNIVRVKNFISISNLLGTEKNYQLKGFVIYS